ncbi:kinase-like domain-containing protein [Boletus reticuloceps]|uniref:Kinase-like domain-containing protein n=1 Tax=Boletus reticuloceps TaxID=495285 RepID=A0A8I3A8D2_9AGAM|nr:kinase-like domain-containing protein [Boletus reticuloceps]
MQTLQDSMNTDDIIEEQTQQATQSTQYSGSQSTGDANGHLWGFLQPCSTLLKRIDFFKIQPTVSIGRHKDENEIILPGVRVSAYSSLCRSSLRVFLCRIDAFLAGNRHCRIVWDGKEDDKSAVIVADYSSNGTFVGFHASPFPVTRAIYDSLSFQINGIKIGKDKTAILKEGNEIAFGTATPQPGSVEDYRFIYRHTAGGPAQGGVHAFYDISHELGKGSFATVMKAISRATGQWFAIKMIHESKVRRVTANDNKSDNDKAETAFMREIAILEDLDHPNICKLKEVFRDHGNIDLVLEFVDGGDLLDHILKTSGIDEEMTIHITRQICSALAYIHGKGIAHRDLKPENVLLTSDHPPNVKVADFGLAKVVDSYTFLKTMCGTPSYLAPEVVTQSDQHPGYSHLVDSWSLGVIVFSMLTSASPFIEDEGQRDMKVRIAQRTIDWSSLDNIHISELGRDFIRRLLEYDPRCRLSLSEARHHPWLNQSGPAAAGANSPRETRQSFSSLASFPDSSLTSIADDEDEAMADPTRISEPSMSAGLQQLQLDQSPQRNGGRAPIQRRSQVIANAAENNIDLPEPSWQMLDTAGPQCYNGGRGEHHAAQWRHAEKGKQTASSDAQDSATGGDAPAPPKRGGIAGRGRGRGRGATQLKTRLQEAAAGMVVEEDHMDDETEPPRPRRSSRTSPNKGRRA